LLNSSKATSDTEITAALLLRGRGTIQSTKVESSRKKGEQLRERKAGRWGGGGLGYLPDARGVAKMGQKSPTLWGWGGVVVGGGDGGG